MFLYEPLVTYVIMMQTNKFARCLPRLCAQSKRDTLQREQICVNVRQIC